MLLAKRNNTTSDDVVVNRNQNGALVGLRRSDIIGRLHHYAALYEEPFAAH
jgi:hypothetical protein